MAMSFKGRKESPDEQMACNLEIIPNIPYPLHVVPYTAEIQVPGNDDRCGVRVGSCKPVLSSLARRSVQGLFIIPFRAENTEGPKGTQIPIRCHVQWLDSVMVTRLIGLDLLIALPHIFHSGSMMVIRKPQNGS